MSATDPADPQQLRRVVAGQADEIARLRVLAGLAPNTGVSPSALDETESSVWRCVQAAGLGRWDHDLVTGKRFWDARTKAIFGLSSRDAGPPDRDSFLGLVLPEDRDRIDRETAAAESDPDYGPFIQRYRVVLRPSGEIRSVASFGRAVFEGGRCVRFAGVTQDVTEQRRLEEALHRVNETLEAQVADRTQERDEIWQLSQDLMVVIDATRHVLAANPAWLPLLGRPPDQLRRWNLFDLVHSDDHRSAEAAFGLLVAGQAVPPTEVRMRHADGRHRVISWAAAARRGKIYAVGRDVTSNREAAEALARTEAELRHSQKMEAVGQLTGGLAHDFNNLLTGIIGGLEVVKTRIAQGRTTGLDRFIEAAAVSATRAASLTHRLLAFSRRQTLNPQPVDAGRLVASLVELVGRTVGPGIAVDWFADDGLWLARCDANQLESALLNLAINARDAMPRGGRLSFACRNLPGAAEAGGTDCVAIIVADTGEGMAPETLQRVFEPFFTTKPLGQGTGLGLSMIYGFVRQSGGRVLIGSKPGEGTTVRLLLPRAASEAAGLSGPASPPARHPAGQCVLVVDDEPAVRMVVAEALLALGYKVTEAGDGPSALDLLRAGVRADVLVTDFGLPGGMTGRQLADAACRLRPGLPVLLITGYSDQTGDELRYGGAQVLTKPFSLDRLTACVASLQDGRASQSGAAAEPDGASPQANLARMRR